jgi:hypothetical protein
MAPHIAHREEKGRPTQCSVYTDVVNREHAVRLQGVPDNRVRGYRQHVSILEAKPSTNCETARERNMSPGQAS